MEAGGLEVCYGELEENRKEETCCEALVNEKQKWQEAGDARLEGRARKRGSKMGQSDATIDASSSAM